jgi:hypothetical protein
VLCDTGSLARGASWGDDNNIVAALDGNSALSRVPAEGGKPQSATKLQAGVITHRWPQSLPGGKAILFTLSSDARAFEEASIAAVSVKTGEIKILARGGYFGRYLPTAGSTGHLIYIHEGVALAAPFDPARLELRGTPVPVLENLASDPIQGSSQLDFSRTGNLTYRSGTQTQAYAVVWLENSGKTEPLLAKPAIYYNPRLSPDGQRLAVSVASGRGRDLWISDYKRDIMTRLTFDGLALHSVWTPDGKRLVYNST